MTRIDQVLELFRWEPAPSQAGANAGTRTEGVEFARKMRALLLPPGDTEIVVETALGKSSKGEKLDGNASERVSHKMLRFKRNPFLQDHLLVVAMNCAFQKYNNAQIVEIRDNASWLNGLDRRGQIIVLSTEKEYREYVLTVFGEET